MESPCILVCSIDMVTGYCHGCGRTSAEIGAWTLYDDARRRKVMDALPARMETIEKKPRRETKRQRIARMSAGGATPDENGGGGGF